MYINIMSFTSYLNFKKKNQIHTKIILKQSDPKNIFAIIKDEIYQTLNFKVIKYIQKIT